MGAESDISDANFFQAANSTNMTSLESSWGSSCCSACSSHPFCSPRSGNCYNYQGKAYYTSCSAQGSRQNCCSHCGSAPFCSPVSGRCYANMAKNYYQSCSQQPVGGQQPPVGQQPGWQQPPVNQPPQQQPPRPGCLIRVGSMCIPT